MQKDGCMDTLAQLCMSCFLTFTVPHSRGGPPPIAKKPTVLLARSLPVYRRPATAQQDAT